MKSSMTSKRREGSLNSEDPGNDFSIRFHRHIRLTYHARERMAERQITEELLRDMIETGTATYKDECRVWLSKAYPDRDDNLLCAAVVLEDDLIVKRVMHRWEVKEQAS